MCSKRQTWTEPDDQNQWLLEHAGSLITRFLFWCTCKFTWLWVTHWSHQETYVGVATFVAVCLPCTSGTLLCLALAEVIKGQLSGDVILSPPNRCRAELTAATLTPHMGWTWPRQMELCLSPILSSALSVWIDAAFSCPGGAGGNVSATVAGIQ